MLIRYTVENFLSFNNASTFSMLPGKGTLKKEHKTKAVKGVSLLKTSIILGANASGKTNLVKAINFGKVFVLKGFPDGGIIDYSKFRLDKDAEMRNSKMEHEIQCGGRNYAYGFVFNKQRIEEEWLYEIGKNGEKMIYERIASHDNPFNLDYLLKKNPKPDDGQFIRFVAKGTPDNQLFLREIVVRRGKENTKDVSDLYNVFGWFLNTLKVISPETKYKQGIKSEISNDEDLHRFYEELLRYFGTGVDGVCLEDAEVDSLKLSDEYLDIIKEDVMNSKAEEKRCLVNVRGALYVFSRNNNELQVRHFMTEHLISDGARTNFETNEESDGTNRIIDLIPMIIDLANGGNVFVVDEIERSLHPNLTYDIFDMFLSFSENKDSQLIATTHESSLLTQKLLRRDEIWFAVKDRAGATSLHSLEDYAVRFDKEIRKDYLLGRFKAVPRLGSRYELSLKPLKNA